MRFPLRLGVPLGILTSLVATAVGAEAQTVTLSETLAAAMEHHPSIRAAGAGLAGAEATLRAAKATRIPAVVASGSMVRFQEPMIVAPLHGLDFSVPPEFDQTLIQGQVGLAYTVFDGGGRGARIEAAGAGSSVAASHLADTEMALIEAVVEAYLAVLTTDAVLEAAQRRTTSLEAERDRAQRLVIEGSTPRLHELRASAALTDAQASLVSARSRSALARRNVARLSGMDAGLIAETGFTPLVRPEPPPRSAAKVSPLVEQARSALAGAHAGLAEARASRLPTLAASAGLLNFGSSAGDFVTEWQAGLQVSWPVFTGGARPARITQAESTVESAEEHLRLVELQVDGAVDAARSRLEEAQGRADALAAAVRQWEEVVRIERLSLAEGVGVQSDFLQAEAGLFQARAGHAEATHTATLARVGLERALGRLNRTWIVESLENER